MQPHSPSLLDVQRIKQDFPILQKVPEGRPRLVFLDSAASSQKPQTVIDAMTQCMEQYYANVHRGIYSFSEESTERYELARQTIAQFLNTDTESVIFTAGCTASVNTIARSWGDAEVQRGDLIVATQMEHHANLVPWFQLAQRKEAQVQLVRVTDDGELDWEHWQRCLEQNPKIVAFTAVSNVLGTINPVARMVQAAHRAGAIAVVDAAQAAPHQPLDVRAWDADFVVVSGHKMLGPSGIGILCGKPELLNKMPPFLGGGGMISKVWETGFSCAEGPAKFEAGTPPIVEAIGLAAAANYLTKLGLNAIHEHETKLLIEAHRILSTIEGVRILGPSLERKAGIVSFTLAGIHSHDIAYLIDSRGISVRAGHHCTMPLHDLLGIPASTRASLAFYNTCDEIDALCAGLRHAQKVLSRRRTR